MGDEVKVKQKVRKVRIIEKELATFLGRESEAREHIWKHIEQVTINRFFSWRPLRFSGDKVSCELLERRFQLETAVTYRSMLQMLALANIIWFSGYLPLVWTWESMQTAKYFYLGFLLVTPGLYAAIVSRIYLRHPQWVMLTIVLFIALCFCVRKIVVKDLSNVFFSMYTIMTFNGTPLTAFNATIVSVIPLVIFFAASLMLLEQKAQTTITTANTNVQNSTETETTTTEGMSLVDYLLLVLTNVVLLFSLIFLAVRRELHLRKAVVYNQVLLSKAAALEDEAEKAQALLRSMLPDVVAQQLKENQANQRSCRIAERFHSVTVMFVSVCDFAQISATQKPENVVDILNIVFSEFDSLVECHNAHKVETVGQVYMVVGGCPEVSSRHGYEIGVLALALLNAMPKINKLLRKALPTFQQEIKIKIGLNSGPIVAGVVGQKNPRYKLFGDTVNTASRMGSTCPPSHIQCSDSTYALIANDLVLEHRGLIPVKGKGEMNVYFLKSEHAINDGKGPESFFGSDSLFKSTKPSKLITSDLTSMIPKSPARPSKVVPMDGDKLVQAYSSSAGMEGNNGIDDDDDDYEPGQLSSLRRWCLSIESKMATESHRLLKFLQNLFRPVGTEEFQKKKRARGIADLSIWVGRVLKFLLVPGLLVVVGLYAIRDNSAALTFNDEQLNGSIVLIGFCTIMCLIIKHMTNHIKYQLRIYRVVVFTYLIIQLTTTYFNVYSSRPNNSVAMAMINVFFTMESVPLVYRAGATTAGAFIYFMAVIWAMEFGEAQYVAYTEDDLSFNKHDVFIQSMFVGMTIMVHIWLGHLNDRLEFHDFSQEMLIKQNSELLDTKKEETTALLYQLLPKSIVPILLAAERKHGPEHVHVVDRFENVTILFTDMVHFTAFSRRINPLNLMEFLDAMYSRFDKITEKYEQYRVEIIGDAYFLVGGCPEKCHSHTERVIKAAMEMLETMPELRKVGQRILQQQQEEELQELYGLPEQQRSNERIQALIEEKQAAIPEPDISIRVGVHVGPVVAGVVGFKDPRYHLFGDAVALAEMMESKGVPGQLHISSQCYQTLLDNQQHKQFNIEQREEIDLSPLAPPQKTFLVKPEPMLPEP